MLLATAREAATGRALRLQAIEFADRVATTSTVTLALVAGRSGNSELSSANLRQETGSGPPMAVFWVANDSFARCSSERARLPQLAKVNLQRGGQQFLLAVSNMTFVAILPAPHIETRQ